MIHRTEYVRELLRKRLEGALSAEEAAMLRAARRLHGRDVWDRLMAEVLEEGGEEGRNDALARWTPDFRRIKQRADRVNRFNTVLKYMVGTTVAAVALVVIWFGFDRYRSGEPGVAGECAGMPPGMEIPVSEFAGAIAYGDRDPLPFQAGSEGHIATVGNLAIIRDSSGILVISEKRKAAEADTAGHRDIRITTAGFQQCGVRLPDGTYVRLNASSTLVYPLSVGDESIHYTRIAGEALVRVPEKRGGGRVIVETHNSQLHSSEGDFSVWTNPWETRITVLDGTISAIARKGGLSRTAGKRGDRIRVKSTRGVGKQINDSLFYHRKRNVNDALMWTSVVRNYRNASLRDFVVDMSRWYGLPATRLHCIPESDRVTTSLCYRATRQDLIAVINRAGLQVYESNGQYSFCRPEDIHHTPGVMHARATSETESCDHCGNYH